MSNTVTIQVKQDLLAGDVSCLSVKIIQASQDPSELQEKTLQIPLKQGQFSLPMSNDNNEALISHIDSDNLILSFPNEFVKSVEGFRLAVNPKGELKIFATTPEENKLLITDGTTSPQYEVANQLDFQKIDSLTQGVKSATQNVKIDKLILKSDNSIEFAGKAYFSEIEIAADLFVNHGVLNSKKCTIKCQEDLTNFGEITANERLEFNLENGVLYNEGVVCCLDPRNSGKIKGNGFIYRGCGIKVGSNGVIYALNNLQFRNYGDLYVAGQIVSGFELYYDGGGHIKVCKDAFVLSKNRAYINCRGFAEIDGTIGARIDFSLRPDKGLKNSSTGRIGSKGFLTIDTAGKLENFNSIEAGFFLQGSAREISNFSKILSKGHTELHGYAKFDNQGDLLTKGHGVFNAHGSDFTNGAGARIVAGHTKLCGRNVYNLATHYLREAEFLHLIEHTSLDHDVIKYAKFCLHLIIDKDPAQLTANQQEHVQTLVALLNEAETKASVLFAKKLDSEIIPKFINYAKQAAVRGELTDLDEAALQPAVGLSAVIAEMSYKPGGLIAGLQSLEINAESFANAGLVVSNFGLNLTHIEHINNLISGYILAFGITNVHAQATLLNAGMIISKIKTDIKASDWLVNLVTGRLGGDDIIMKAKQMENFGQILGGNVTIQMQDIFKQYATGKITGVEALKILSGEVINEGIVYSFKTLDIEVTSILDNAVSGMITANNAILLVCAGIVKNVGEIKSCNDIVIKAKEVMLDLTSSKVVAAEQIKILAEFAVKNAGLLSGKNMELITSNYASSIKFLQTSNISVESIKVVGNEVQNAGNITATGKINIAAKVLFENVARGLISAKDAITIVSDQVKNQCIIESLKTISLTVKDLIDNQGKISSQDSIGLLCAEIIRNTGNIEALKQVNLEAKQILQQSTDGKVIAGEQLALIAKLLITNSGILGGQSVDIKVIDGWLKNLAGSKVKAADNLTATATQTHNAGELTSQGKINLAAKVLFENVATGLISAKDAIKIKSDRLINAGFVDAMHSIALDVQNVLQNNATGTLSSEGSIAILCASIIENLGTIEALGSIKLEAAKILQQSITGKIISQAQLNLIAKFAIENSGLIFGKTAAAVTSEVNSLVKNLNGGQLLADLDLTVSSKAIENNGMIRANIGKITLKEHLVFTNLANGIIRAKDALDILGVNGNNFGEIIAKNATLDFSGELTNSGKISTEEKLTLKAHKTLFLLRNGKMQAKDALKIISDLKVYTEADILAYRTLLMMAPTIEHASGQIESKQDVTIEALDWILAGYVKAGHDVIARVKRNWTRKPSGTFEAHNSAKLHLDQGYTFDQILSAKNHLEIHGNSSSKFNFHADVTAAGDLIISGSKVINGVHNGVFSRLQAGRQFKAKCDDFDNQHGGVFGQTDVTIDTKHQILNGRARVSSGDLITVNGSYSQKVRRGFFGYKYISHSTTVQIENTRTESNGSFIVSGGTGNFKSGSGGLINDHAEIYVAKDCQVDLQSGGLKNIAGKVRFASNAAINADCVDNEMRYSTAWSADNRCGVGQAWSARPIFSIGGNAKIATSAGFRSKGGDLNVGGSCEFARGGFDGTELEEFKHSTNVAHRTEYSKGSRRYGCCGPHEDISYTVSYDVVHHETTATHSARLNVGGNVIGTDPTSQYKISGMSVGGRADLQFTDLGFARPIDKTFMQQQPKQRVVDLDHYLDPNSQLFTKLGTESKQIKLNIPLTFNDYQLPVNRVYCASEQAFRSGQHAQASVPKYDPEAEAMLVHHALIDIGVPFIGKAADPGLLLQSLLNNAEKYRKSLNKPVLNEADLFRATEPMLVYSTDVEDSGELVSKAKLVLPEGALLTGVKAKSAELHGSGLASRLTIADNMDIEEFFTAKVGTFGLEVDSNLRVGTVLDLIVAGNVSIAGDIEAQDLFIKSLLADVEIKSERVRRGSSENFADCIQQARVAAKNILVIIAGGNIVFQGAETESGLAGTHIEALANILDVPVQLIRQRVEHFSEKRKTGRICETWVTQHTSTHKTLGEFNSFAGGNSTLYAPTIEATSATIASKVETIIKDVSDGYSRESHISSKKKQWHGGSKKTSSQSMSQKIQSRGAKFKIKQDLRISGSNIELTNIHSEAAHNVFSAPDGKAAILQGVNQSSFAESNSSSDVFWRKSDSESEQRKTYSSSSFTGTIEIDAKSINLEIVSGEVLSFLQQIMKHSTDLTFVTLKEEYQRQCDSNEGPGVGLIALAALAVAILTAGTASGLSASLLGAAAETGAAAGAATGAVAGAAVGAAATGTATAVTAGATMVAGTTITAGSTLAAVHTALTAGITCMISQATASMVANTGDLGKVIKDLSRKDAFEKLAISMISAGVMDKISTQLKLPPRMLDRNTTQHAAYYTSKCAIDTGLNVSIAGQNLDQAITNGLKDTAVSIAVASAGSKIDGLAEKGKINQAEDTIMQAAVGVAKSAVLGDPNGLLIGAMSAVISARLNDRNNGKKRKDRGKDRGKDGGIDGDGDRDRDQELGSTTPSKRQAVAAKAKPETGDVVDHEQFAKQWEQLSQEQKLELILLQQDKVDLTKQIANRLHNYAKQQSAIGNGFDVQAAFEKMQDDIKLMDSKQFKQFEKDFTLFDLKETKFSQPKLKLTAFVASGGRDSSESPKKDWWQTIQELKDNYVKVTLESDTVEQDLYRSHSITMLDKSKLLYSRWQEARKIVEENDFDLDGEIYKRLSTDLLENSKFLEFRDNFDPGILAFSNSSSVVLLPDKLKSSPKAFDLIRLYQKNWDVGITFYWHSKGSGNVFDFKNFKSNLGNLKGTSSSGVNYLQIKSDHVDVNIGSGCDVYAQANNLLSKSSDGSKGSIQGQCSLLRATANFKSTEVCVGENCLQGDSNVSVAACKVSAGFDPSKKAKVKLDVKPGYSFNSNASVEINKRPKPK